MARHIAETLDAILDELRALRDASQAASRRWLSVEAASQYAGISPESVRSMLSSGKITAHRPVLGRITIDRLELDAVIKSSSAYKPRRGRGLMPATTRAAAAEKAQARRAQE